MSNSAGFFDYDIMALREAFAQGQNITQLLREKNGCNTSEAIEIAYDLQAGSYVEAVEKDDSYYIGFGKEVVDLISPYLQPGDTLLDAGTGEMTILGFILQALSVPFHQTYAFDISWSRIKLGQNYAQGRWPDIFSKVQAFVGDMKATPLPDKSIDVTITNHALESNGSSVDELLLELMRVTRRHLVLFEPCYELNTPEGQQRMDRLGYIKGLDKAVERLGGKVILRQKLNNIINPLNPTTCFVIEPKAAQSNPVQAGFTVPGTNDLLEPKDGFLFSKTSGLAFPVLQETALLKPSNAILASAMV